MRDRLRYAVAAFLLPILVMASGCAFVPDWDAVLDDRYLAPDPVEDPVELELRKVRADIEAQGFTILQVPDVRMPRKLRGRQAVTIHSSVVLAPTFPKLPKPEQLRILRHEYSHVLEWKGRGHIGFAATYATDNGRFVIEGHGLRQEVRDRCDAGEAEADVRAWIPARIEHYADRYHYQKRHRDAVAQATR